MDVIDKHYTTVVNWGRGVSQGTIPYFRMLMRFFALPYAYIVLVNWKECKASRFQVVKDFLYIFFVLRDFPDYYTVFRFWEKERSEWSYYYGSIYNPFQRGKLRKEVQKKEYEILFEDKYVCNQLCNDADLPLPDFLGYVEPSDNLKSIVIKLFEGEPQRKVIIKSARGKGGRDIFLAYKSEKGICIEGNNEKYTLNSFNLKYPSIIQEFIKQHDEIEQISCSINTIRIETILSQDANVLVIGAFIRFGLNGNFLDNQCAGGLSVGVDVETGALYNFAMNGRGEKFSHHPDTGFEFKGFVIPFWAEVLALSKNIQNHFSCFRLLGPDIAITPHGPVIIEINATPDHAGLEMDYGPVLKNEEVWKVFNSYGLLINSPSKNLYQ